MHIPDQVDHESGTIISIIGNESTVKSTYLDEDNLRDMQDRAAQARRRANDTTEEPDMDEDKPDKTPRVDGDSLHLRESDYMRDGEFFVDADYDDMGELKISMKGTKRKSQMWLTKPQVYDLRRHLDAIDGENYEFADYDDDPEHCITHLSTCVDNDNRIITTVVLDNGEILQHTDAALTRAWKKITPPESIEP